MAVTAPVCPRRTEIGTPSGKRHCHHPEGFVKDQVKENIQKEGKK